MYWFVLLVSSVLEAVWAIALSESDGFTRIGPTVVFAIAVTLSMIGLGYAMQGIPTSVAYTVWVGGGAALTVTASMISGSEEPSPLKILFLAGIIACVIGLKFTPAAKTAAGVATLHPAGPDPGSDKTPEMAETPQQKDHRVNDILVSAIALIRDRRVLMVTARGRDVWYMPGGKIDPGETGAEGAAREAFEEVTLQLEPENLEELFTVVTQAHGEPDGRLVRMRVFGAATQGEPTPSAEVSAVHWASTANRDLCPPAGREVLDRLFELGLID